MVLRVVADPVLAIRNELTNTDGGTVGQYFLTRVTVFARERELRRGDYTAGMSRRLETSYVGPTQDGELRLGLLNARYDLVLLGVLGRAETRRLDANSGRGSTGGDRWNGRRGVVVNNERTHFGRLVR